MNKQTLRDIDRAFKALDALDIIKSEIERKADSGLYDEPVVYGMVKALAIIERVKREVGIDEG